MTILMSIEPPSKSGETAPAGFALWRLGFRPFYLLGALYAGLAVPLWVAAYAGALALPGDLPAQWWHAHEMVFGFALAIVTGFLFTAVRNWTGQPTPTGWRLAALCGLWLAARVGFLAGTLRVAVVIELVFLAFVATSLLAPLVRAGNRRNYFVAVLFVVLAVVDLLFLGAARGLIAAPDPSTALRLALYLIVTLTFVIGGRVIPMFTVNAVRGLSQRRSVHLDRAAIGVSVLAFALELAAAPAAALAPAAAAAAALQAARLHGWRPLATRGRPILWILHLSYAWIPLGFLLMAAAALGWTAPVLAWHAFSIGTVGGLVIAMVTRTALGHTGRMLVAGPAEVAMYLCVAAAALVRVVPPLIVPQAYAWALWASSLLWSAGFLLYAAVYWPRLSRPRIDGRDG
jgi:uncharacterized protein involved in response to NO